MADAVNASSANGAAPTVLALFETGLAAYDAGSAEEALAAWSEVVESYWEASERDVRALVARALFAKADTLREAGRLEDALADCARLDAIFLRIVAEGPIGHLQQRGSLRTHPARTLESREQIGAFEALNVLLETQAFLRQAGMASVPVAIFSRH